jgi:tRNA-splicing endonuclease subunit Sen2
MMSSETRPPPRTKKPNYNILHANPLPLTIQPLPPLIPHNPFSLLQIAYVYFFCRANCQAEPLYTASFSPSTRSVNVTDRRSIQAFWNSGFFGKGSLSRSEPTWISRRRRALGVIGKDENLTAEEITERRRRERREFKQERARAEKERIQQQLAQEGKLELPADVSNVESATEDAPAMSVRFAPVEENLATGEIPIIDIQDLEHLQLTLEEAFFLMFGLGALKLTGPEGNVCLATTLCYLDCKSNRIDRNLLQCRTLCFSSEAALTSRLLRTM